MNRTSLLCLLAFALPLAAQQPDSMKHPMMGMGEHGMMGPGMMEMMGGMPGMEAMMGPMMEAMAFSPAHLLEHPDALQLTPAQVTKLTQIRDAAKAATDAAMADVRTHMGEMHQAMNAAVPDTNVMKTHFQAGMAAMSKAHWAGLVAAAQARAVLTDLQRGRVEGMMAAMQMMMQMRRDSAREGEEHERHPEH